MIMNLLIVTFLIFMFYWWGRQGVFSAFMHLVAVIAAGALSLAIWEPFVLAWLLPRLPAYAWGVGLLGPFILLLILIRTAIDKSVRGNMYFSMPVNRLAGGVLGGLSGILTAGLTVIALGFLTLPQDFAGYQRYVVNGAGELEETGSPLWWPVDRQAAGFFNMLSGGAFFSGVPMREYQPDLAQQADIFRMRYDNNASVTASPNGVKVVAAGIWNSPLRGVDDLAVRAIGEDARQKGKRIAVIDTAWTATSTPDGTFDADSVARVYATQIRLVTVSAGDSGEDPAPELVAPVGFVKLDPDTKTKTYISLRDQRSFATVDRHDGTTLGWVFSISDERKPRFLLVRHLRFNLPDEFVTDMGLAAAFISTPPSLAKVPVFTPEPNGPSGDGSKPGETQGPNPGSAAAKIEATGKLPTIISKNVATNFDYKDNGILSGKATVAPPPGFIPKEVAADRIFTYPTESPIRLEIEAQKAQSTFGTSRAMASSLGGVSLTDRNGTDYAPIGYCWYKPPVQEISINREAPIRSSRELPVGGMGPSDKLYLYFVVPRGVVITKITIGTGTQDVNNLTAP